MARCFLTGVEFRVQEGRVLNRSGAFRLLRELRQRAESLERLIAQLSPLDEPAESAFPAGKGPTAKRHRLVCKSVAEALGQAYPEIELLIPWPELPTRAVRDRMRVLNDHPSYGGAISALSDNELVRVGDLGRRVLRHIDPRREVSQSAQLAITAGVCVRHRDKTPPQIAELIRAVICGGGDPALLGVPEGELELVWPGLRQVLNDGAPETVPS